MSRNHYHWAAPGDINAFFGLVLDNTANLLLTVGLLAAVFEFPTNFAIRSMIPGTAIGVLVGDLLFFWMAFRLARRTGRQDVTAMPLGLDTPSTLGMVFFVLGPAFTAARQVLPVEEAARHTWHIGICALLISGLFKFVCAAASSWVRRVLPRAGLLGSLAAIALVLISFIPLLEILREPLVGFVALAVVLAALVARIRLPWGIPGALAAAVVAGAMYYGLQWTGQLTPAVEPLVNPREALWPYEWLAVFRCEWVAAFPETVKYLPIVLPFALGTVIGGIDCTESAAAAGDEYHTGRVIAVEALATVVAGLCGGVIQTTPYIGHPAYKAMGGRAAYTLATAVFLGGAGLIGYFGYLYVVIPRAAVLPILLFIGLEITSQSFQATPPRHYPALAWACMPALAALAMIYVDKLLGDAALATAGIGIATLADATLRQELQTLRVLANGFIVTSLLWASALAELIDRRLMMSAAYWGIAAACTLFGIIHSPQPGSPLFLPWHLPPDVARITLSYAAAYAVAGLLLLVLGWWNQQGRLGGAERSGS